MNAYEIMQGLAPGESLDYERYDCPSCGAMHIVLIRRLGAKYLVEVLTGNGGESVDGLLDKMELPAEVETFEDAKIEAEVVYARLDAGHQTGECLA